MAGGIGGGVRASLPQHGGRSPASKATPLIFAPFILPTVRNGTVVYGASAEMPPRWKLSTRWPCTQPSCALVMRLGYVGLSGPPPSIRWCVRCISPRGVWVPHGDSSMAASNSLLLLCSASLAATRGHGLAACAHAFVAFLPSLGYCERVPSLFYCGEAFGWGICQWGGHCPKFRYSR